MARPCGQATGGTVSFDSCHFALCERILIDQAQVSEGDGWTQGEGCPFPSLNRLRATWFFQSLRDLRELTVISQNN